MKAHLTLIGAVLLLAGCSPPAHSSSSASPSAVASRSPAASPTVPPVSSPVVGRSEDPLAGPCAYPSAAIPDKVMVRDVFRTGSHVVEVCVDHAADEASFEYLPDPCGRELGLKTSSIAARRAVEVVFDDDASSDDVRTSMYRHTVTAYNSSDAASAYLSSVRAAVRECPVRRFPSWTWKYAIVSSTAQRLDLSVRRIADHPAEGGESASAVFRISVFRSGARVSVVSDVGWEGHPSAESAVDALVKAASEQLDRWE